MPENNQYISGYCTIEPGRISLNGKPYFEMANTDFPDFAKEAYRHMGTDYPKFFKMDNLSKLAFLAGELILKDIALQGQENNIALLFANKSSSLDTDVKYYKSIADKKNYHPSPSVFVYTLPNICMGEISIRYKLHTENAFFIFESFNAEFFMNYAGIMLAVNKAEKILCGWIEYYGNEYKAFMYLVSGEGTIEHTVNNINELFYTL